MTTWAAMGVLPRYHHKEVSTTMPAETGVNAKARAPPARDWVMWPPGSVGTPAVRSDSQPRLGGSLPINNSLRRGPC